MTVSGARARYFCAGSGPPLLLLASPLALGRTYASAARALGRSFTVVCVELPGSGGSAKLAEPWSPERYAEWTLELIRHLPLAAPIVVGHAASVPVALHLAQLAPAEVGGVVLANAPGSTHPFELRALPRMVWNALHHRATFAEHMKTACGAPALTAAAAALPVPTLATQSDPGAEDALLGVQPFASAVRRFVASVRRSARGASLRAAGAATEPAFAA